MHLYTLAHGDELLCMGWLAEQPGEAFLAAEVPGYPLPAGAAVICDLYTFPAHRRRGHARTVLRAILRDAAAAGSRSVVLPVPAASEAARRLVEELGSVYAGSIRSITRWGRTAHGSDFPASAAPATPLQSSSATGAPAVPAVHVE
jgi:ribosomal protein S18 acetylase RimI-like enzyme